MESKENYCFHHNIQFENNKLYAQHRLKCRQLLDHANVCTQFASNGSMCGKFFVRIKDLCKHAEESHGVLLCESCDYQSVNPQSMASHYHSKPVKDNIHTSKSSFQLPGVSLF